MVFAALSRVTPCRREARPATRGHADRMLLVWHFHRKQEIGYKILLRGMRPEA